MCLDALLEVKFWTSLYRIKLVENGPKSIIFKAFLDKKINKNRYNKFDVLSIYRRLDMTISS